ncbi:MAG TPA: hypothetical protein VNV37_00420 [Solirubrobacteraceae bacterium]|nr:hypothetical protein [Solirubrobacteraceae bacterium]
MKKWITHHPQGRWLRVMVKKLTGRSSREHNRSRPTPGKLLGAVGSVVKMLDSHVGPAVEKM